MKPESIKSIGNYQIRARLGQGSMGQVYKVVLPEGTGFAALKLLKPHPGLMDKMGKKRIYDQFIHEFSIIADLRHPNVVPAWNLEEKDGQVYFLMEYFPRNLGVMVGESYFADTPSRMLRIGKAVAYITETLEGVSRLHKEGIVHQDIKPFNLMLTENDTVKITDFGLSKRRGEKFITSSELMIGTPHYAAPEQIESPEKADHRADLYAVGVMLYRMLTGVLPQKPFKPPSLLNIELEAGWDELIHKSIHHNPDKRFQDATSMILEINSHYQKFNHQKQMDCMFSENLSAPPRMQAGSHFVFLRSKAERVLAKHAKSAFSIDALHRPQKYLEHSPGPAKDGVIVDAITNLAWQQAGSESPMPWEGAKLYITGLNQQGFGGYGNWRMPTINELLSLIKPPPPGEDFCFQSQFSSLQKWVWSGDTRSKRAAWFVDAEMGFVASGDILDRYFVKAVCSL